MAKNQISIFKYGEQSVRTTEINGETWFSGNDVASILGYKNIRDAIKKHCEKKGVAKRDALTKMGVRELIFINESNVYRLINKSRIEGAENFRNWIVEVLLPQFRKYGSYNKDNELPDFVKRFTLNSMKIPYTHFCVINELYTTIYKELEKCGYIIPDKAPSGKTITIDISVGQTFASYLKENYPEYHKSRITYEHEYPDGRHPKAYMYELDALPIFRKFVYEIWLKDYAENFFKKRDPKALDFIPKAIGTTIEEIKKEAKNVRLRQGLVKKAKITIIKNKDKKASDKE